MAPKIEWTDENKVNEIKQSKEKVVWVDVPIIHLHNARCRRHTHIYIKIYMYIYIYI